MERSEITPDHSRSTNPEQVVRTLQINTVKILIRELIDICLSLTTYKKGIPFPLSPALCKAEQNPALKFKIFSDGSLTPEALSFLHYARQNLQKSRVSIPIVPDWSESFIPSQGDQLNILNGQSLNQALVQLPSNQTEVRAFFDQQQKKVTETLTRQNLLILANHCTWMNLPTLIAFLHQTYQISLKQINLVLGPALRCYRQGLEVSSISNSWMTIPDTPNGRLPVDLAPIKGKVTKSFLKGTRNHQMNNSQGEVWIICPHGTTDRQATDCTNLLQPSHSVEKLIAKFTTNMAV